MAELSIVIVDFQTSRRVLDCLAPIEDERKHGLGATRAVGLGTACGNRPWGQLNESTAN